MQRGMHPRHILARCRKLASAAMNRIGRFQCPVCEGRLARFEPIESSYLREREASGTTLRLEDCETINPDHYFCPLCRATDRDRLYALYLRSDRYESNHPVRLLDIAPSEPLTRLLGRLDKFEVRTADLLRVDVDDRIDIQDMHIYPDDSFDAFICSHVLEHVPDDRKALSELRRILKPGGFGILMVPINLQRNGVDEDTSVTDPDERLRRFGQADHLRVYSKRGFLERVRSADFGVTELGEADFDRGAFKRYGISSGSVLYVVQPIADVMDDNGD